MERGHLYSWWYARSVGALIVSFIWETELTPRLKDWSLDGRNTTREEKVSWDQYRAHWRFVPFIHGGAK